MDLKKENSNNKPKSKLWILVRYFVGIDFYAFLTLYPNFKKKQGKKIKVNRGKKSQGIMALIAVIYLAVLLVPMGISFVKAIYSLPTIAKSVFSFMCVMIFISMFVLTLSQAYSFIEKSEESEYLLSLPLNGADIIKARIIALGLAFLGFMDLYFLLVIDVSRIQLHHSILSIIFSDIAFILLSAEAVLLASILVLLIGKLIKTSKVFKRFSKIIYLAFSVLFMLLYFFFVFNASTSNQGKNVSISVNYATVMGDADKYVSIPFFFIGWAKNLFLDVSMGKQLVSILIGIISVTIMYFIVNHLAEKNYIGILRSQTASEGENRKTIIKRKNVGLKSKKRGHFRLIFMKELKNIYSDPTYILQIFPMDIVMVVVVIFMIMTMKEHSKDIRVVLPAILNAFSTSKKLAIFFGIGCAMGLMSGIGSIVTSSISREGKAFWIMAVSPIKITTQLLARILACQVSHLAVYVVLLVATLFVYVLNPIYYVVLILGSTITLIGSAALSMMFGLIKPNFDWKSSKEAVNGGAGGLFAFLGVFIIYGLFALLGAILYWGSKYNIDMQYLIYADFGVLLLISIGIFVVDYYLYRRVIHNL